MARCNCSPRCHVCGDGPCDCTCTEAEKKAHLTQPAQAVDVSDSDVVRALCRTFGDGYGPESEDMYLSPHNERLFNGMREALREFALNQAGAKIEYGSSVNPETLIREALTAALPKDSNGAEGVGS